MQSQDTASCPHLKSQQSSPPALLTEIHFLKVVEKDESKHWIFHKFLCLVRSTEWLQITQYSKNRYKCIKRVLKRIQTKLHIRRGASLFCYLLHERHFLCTDVSINDTHIDSVRTYILIANNARITVNATFLTDNPGIRACTNISRVVWNHDVEYVVNCDRRSPKEEVIPNDCELYKSYIKRELWKCY